QQSDDREKYSRNAYIMNGLIGLIVMTHGIFVKPGVKGFHVGCWCWFWFLILVSCILALGSWLLALDSWLLTLGVFCRTPSNIIKLPLFRLKFVIYGS